jgi:zinc transport system substrate-binding protein
VPPGGRGVKQAAVPEEVCYKFGTNASKDIIARLMRRLILLIALFYAPAAVAASPEVAVTIKPLHSLASRIMAEVAIPQQIIRGGLSPHRYAPRPSETRALHAADLVIWVGRMVEPGLAKTMATLEPSSKVLTLGDAPELNLLPARAGGSWAAHEEHHEAHNSEIHDRDPHFWLDPNRARAASNRIARALITVDPDNAAQYRANLDQLIRDLDTLDRELKDTYGPVRNRSLFVFHDAYQYLEHRYDLDVLGALTVSTDQAPGARRVAEIRALLQKDGVTCVLHEPQFKPAMIQVLAEGTGAQLGVIDPLGTEIPSGPDHYFQMMRTAAGSIRSCVGPQP